MAHLWLLSLWILSVLSDDVQYYYCREKTFSDTIVTVSKNIDFISDVTVHSNQNLTMDTASFIVDITGCLTPIGELKDSIGIEIQFQYLPVVYNGAVQNLWKLYMLKMEYCEIKELHSGCFLELPAIRKIYLRFNRIETINEGVFNTLDVSELYLSNNSIIQIDPTAFNEMPNLSLLEMDSNKLDVWNSDWFTNTPNIEHLSLDSNQLQRLPAYAFKKLKNYYSTSIRLSNNQIVYIHPMAFEGLNLLYALWLDNNRLINLNHEVFQQFDRIYVLSLSGNKLGCLSEDMLYNFRSKDLILRLENNQPMNCECLKIIQRWAGFRNYFFTEKYAREECDRKKKSTDYCVK